MAIISIQNHSLEQVSKVIKSLGFEFELCTTSKGFKPKDNTIYGFFTLSILRKARGLKTTPILFEAPSIINHIELNTKVIHLDYKRFPDGLLVFTDIDRRKLKHYLEKPFIESSLKDIVYKRNVQPNNGTSSKLTVLVNTWLATIPLFTHEPFMVAFANAVKTGNWKAFEKLIKENRLVTVTNKKELSLLLTKVEELKPTIKALVGKDTNTYNRELKLLLKKDKTNIFCVRRMRFYLKYWGEKNIKDYLDAEGNMNYIV